MKRLLLLILVVGTALAQEEERDKRQSANAYYRGAPPQQKQAIQLVAPPRFPAIGNAAPQGFRAPAAIDEDEDEGLSRNTVAPSTAGPQALLLLRQSHPTPQPQQQQPIQYRRPIDYQAQQQVARPQQVQQQLRRPQAAQRAQIANQPIQEQEQELEEEKEEPDRLSVLLPQSKFDCTGKRTGYYADDGLNCEVFHYCQDNARHSWICPEGFVFHQVHLICMPPSSENICQQSQQFHFVNEYLYRPVNAEEVQTKPNITLRYSDRFYPDSYLGGYYDEDQSQGPAQVQAQPQPQPVQRQPVRLVPQQQVITTPRGRPIQQATIRPIQQQFRPANQVFHSPEEVNIPLQQRRPAHVTQAPQRFPHAKDDEYEYDDAGFRG